MATASETAEQLSVEPNARDAKPSVKSNVRNASLATAERVITGVGRVAVAILVTRTLGAEGQGIFALMVSVWSVVAVWSVMGIEIANNFFGARLTDPGERGALLGNTLVFCATAGIVGGAAVWAAFRWTGILDTLPDALMPIVVMGTVLTAFVVPIGNLLYGFEAFGSHLLGTLAQMVLFIAGTFVLALVGVLNEWWLGVVWLVSVGASVGYWFFSSSKQLAFRVRFDWPLLRRQLKYGLNGYLYNAFNVVNFRLDVLLLAQFVTAEIVGLYSIAVAVTEAVLFIPKGLTNVVMSMVSKDGKAGLGVFQVLSSIVLVLVVTTGVCAPVILPMLFGYEFIGSVTPMLILLPGTYFMSMGMVGAFALFGAGKARNAAKAALWAAITTILLNMLFVPTMGAQGAAMASTFSYATFSIMIGRGLMGDKWINMYIPKVGIILNIIKGNLK